MNAAKIQPALRLAVAGGLTALLTAAVLHLLLTRLHDATGAWWAGRVTFAALLATVAAVAAHGLVRGES